MHRTNRCTSNMERKLCLKSNMCYWSNRKARETDIWKLRACVHITLIYSFFLWLGFLSTLPGIALHWISPQSDAGTQQPFLSFLQISFSSAYWARHLSFPAVSLENRPIENSDAVEQNVFSQGRAMPKKSRVIGLCRQWLAGWSGNSSSWLDQQVALALKANRFEMLMLVTTSHTNKSHARRSE